MYKLNKQRKAVTLLETTFVLLIATIAVGGGSYFMSEHSKQQLAKSTANHLIKINGAYKKYIENNYATLAQEVSSYKVINSAKLKEVTHGDGVYSNVSYSYLPSNFQMKNGYGQEYVLSLRKLNEGMIQGVIYSTGGESIPAEQALRISQMVGRSGGFTLKSDPSKVRAAMGGYDLNLTDYGGGSEGGKLVSVVFMNEHSIGHQDYSYRNPIAGSAELNQMKTDLSLGTGAKGTPIGSWNIDRARNVNVLENVDVGNNVDVARNLNVKINASTGGDLSGRGKLTVGSSASIGGNIDVTSGNAIVKQYVHGDNGVTSLKEGVIGGSCSGGEIGKLSGHMTTIFCKAGKWVSIDSTIGRSNAPIGSSPDVHYVQIGNRVGMFCTPLGQDLTAAQGGLYIDYAPSTDKASIHPYCRKVDIAIESVLTDNAVRVGTADHAGTAGVRNNWSTIYKTFNVTEYY